MTENLSKKFQQLQEERTKTFHQLDEDHKIFLSTAPDYENGFDNYKKAVNESTERFKLISKEIIRIKETLEQDSSAAQVAKLIGRVQELEENKLRIVCDLQLARYLESGLLFIDKVGPRLKIKKLLWDDLEHFMHVKNTVIKGLRPYM